MTNCETIVGDSQKKGEICTGTLGSVEKCAFLSGISGTTQHRSAFFQESSQIKFRTTTRNDLAPNFRVLENPKPAKKIMNDSFEHHFGFGLVEIMGILGYRVFLEDIMGQFRLELGWKCFRR